MRHFGATWAILAGVTFAIGLGCGSSDSSKGAGGGTSTGGSGVGAGGTGAGTGTGSTTSGTGATAGFGGTSNTGVGGSLISWGGYGADGGVLCGSTQCTDCKDNDGDGLIDSADPECTSPLDNDESSFATGIPGDNVDPFWQDCFFDGNSGSGDDGCNYNTGCLTGTITPTDPNYTKDCVVSDQCRTFCQKYTPNGCDCFGCCAVDTSTGTVDIQLTATCTLADINDPTKCPRCVQATSCVNTCEHCELCFGMTTLPSDCTADAGTGGSTSVDSGGACVAPVCPSGEQSCGVSCTPACASGTYCTTGCCVDILR